jgi:outer membrane protein insertion porin family
MKSRLTLWCTLLVLMFFVPASFAGTASSDGFKITEIKLEGLQRISKGTVYTYLPVKVGQRITNGETNTIIAALYKTGFFSDVTVLRNGNELIIKLSESPVIGNVELSGNSAIKTDNLMDALKKMDISEGLTYSSAVIERAKIALEEQYFDMGYYGSEVTVTKTKAPRNRVSLSIKVTEGSLAIVKNINFIGNKQVSEKALQDQLKLSTTRWYSWLTHGDRYSKEKMHADAEAISAYYLDHGYLDFKIDSATVQLTPNKSSVYITYALSEGEKYTVSGLDVKGKSVIPLAKLSDATTLKKGDTFSRQQVLDTKALFKDMLGTKGYAFTIVDVKPDINQKTHTVFIHYVVDQGKLAYVRHIAFLGNYKTNDTTLRNKMAQLEGGLVNTDKLKQTKRQLNQLPYIRNAALSTDKVIGTDDKVDINVKVDEVPSAQVTAGIGYSEVDGVLLNATVVQKDVLGTGKSLRATVVNSDYRQTYSIGYTDPFYTTNGITRGFTAYLDSYDPSAANISSDYSYNEYGGRVNYTIPTSATVGATNSVSLGYGFAGTSLDVTEGASTQAQDFVSDYGDRFNEILLTTGWIHNGLNRYVFPTKGVYETAGLNLYLPADTDALGYYKLTANADAYIPFTDRYILKLKGQLGYGAGFIGTSDIPFYNNFYAGGMSSVRGYEANTLGPLDSNGDPFGGNYLMDGSVALIFPNFISPDNLRTSVFFDAGNVYDLEDLTNDSGFSVSDLRYSVGVDMKWLSPLGLLEFTLAKALNTSEDDKTQVFDFMIGASF